ncbi:MAG TPA: TIGR04282 family arsenosugar biosynthesis glycosyltransferase [Thermoanaerobaculia bacterium]|nr:TIGR04282 family arsenosugar biosynthesis glycosyltransferase [Thermoanaerobaculia bacterium]
MYNPPVPPEASTGRRLLLFTKPARAGRVKTRLVGDLTAAQAAELHAAFLADLLDRLRAGSFALAIAWALEPGEPIPPGDLPGVRQEGEGLGERLTHALTGAGRQARAVAALGSDHPTLPVALVERAFAAVEAGARVVLGPAEDGGYYLIALAVPFPRRIFEEIDWSTERVLGQTLERCRELGITPELLPEAADVDTAEDLKRLAGRMAESGSDLGCPRTRALLAAWNLLPHLSEVP